MMDGIAKTNLMGLLALLFIAPVQAWGENETIAMGQPMMLRAEINMEAPASVQQTVSNERHLDIDEQFRSIGGAQDATTANARTVPSEKFPFFLNTHDIKETPELTIGYIRGINTPEAHAMGTSNASFVSSPAVIKVNGVKVQYLYADGNLIKIQIPKQALKHDGFNILQIEAGYYFLPDNRVAYDQIELQNIALNY